MSAYTDMIEKHSVYTKLTEVYTEIDAVKEMRDKPNDDVDAIARISAVIKNFKQALEGCDKKFIVVKWLDDASSALGNIANYLRNYRNNRTASYLTSSCYGQLETLLQNTVRLNCVKSKQSLSGYNSAIEEYTKVMETHNVQLSEKVSALGTRIEELSKNIGDNDKAANQVLNELKTAIASEKSRLDNLATTYQTQMLEDKKTVMDSVDAMQKEFDASQEAKDLSFRQNTDIMQESNNGLIEEFREKFSDYERQVEKVVGTLSANVYSKRYQSVADDAKTRAEKWHKVTVVMLVALVIYAIVGFVITTNNDTSWVKLVSRIFATTTLVSAAAYAARQASKQEKVERYARNMEMQLVAFDPFIATLNDEKRAEIKEEIARKIFGDPYAMEINRKDESYVPLDKLTTINDVMDKIPVLAEKT